MSDPVTNLEIEDVLSSIRRLVSEGEKLRDPDSPVDSRPDPEAKDVNGDEAPDVLELRQEHRADDAAEGKSGTDGTQPDSPVRFVLTSAYRVDDEPADNGDAADPPSAASGRESDAPEADPAPELPAEGRPEASLQGEIVWTDEVLSDPETPQEEASPVRDEDVADASDEVPDWVAQGQAELDAIEAGKPDGSSGSAEDGPEALTEDPAPAPDADETAISPEPAAPAPDRRALESTIAELEAAISDVADEWEPDGSEETPVVDWQAASEAGVFFTSRFASGGPVEDAEFSDTADSRHEAETDEVAEKFDAAEAYFAEAEIEDAADPLDDQLTAYLEQDEVLDEETLRRMVADIVREELQGPLGERITRNVRKLVRREIYRALAEHGFE